MTVNNHSCDLQILLRCCMTSPVVCDVLSGISIPERNSSPVNGGVDGTAVAAIFRLVLLCANASAATKDTSSQTASEAETAAKASSFESLATQSCLVLSTISQGLRILGRHGASCVLTTSQSKQHDRLLAMTQLTVPSSEVTAFQLSAAATLALTSILLLEYAPTNASAMTLIVEKPLSLLPEMSVIRRQLWPSASDLIETKGSLLLKDGVFSSYHGVRDGYVGALKLWLRWGGIAAAEQACSLGFPRILVLLLAGRPDSHGNCGSQNSIIGLSPGGVILALSSIFSCLPGGAFKDVSFNKDSLSVLISLVDEPHLRLLNIWEGFGGGSFGAREIINEVVSILEFPYIAAQGSVSSSVIGSLAHGLNPVIARKGSENGELGKALAMEIPQYSQLLQEVISCALKSAWENSVYQKSCSVWYV